MLCFGRPLAEHTRVRGAQQRVVGRLVGGRGRHDQVHDATQVLEAEARGLHGIGITDRFRLLAGIDLTTTVAVPRYGVLHAGPRIERRLLVFRTLRVRDGRVAPLHRERVVGADLRHEIAERDTVFGLRDVVEARVVHDRRRMPHLRDPRLTADRVDRVHRAALEVVREAEGVADFVRGDELHEASHERIGERERLRALVEMADLREVPLALEVHDVVIHLHVGVDDLAGARIHGAGSHGIRDRRRQPAHHRDGCIFTREVGIVRYDAGYDALGETGLFEGALPLFDASLDPRLEPIGRGWIHVVRDRLLGHAQIADLLIGAFEAPARDVSTRQHALLG